MNSHVLYLIAGKYDAIGDVPTLPMPSKKCEFSSFRPVSVLEEIENFK